MADGTGVSDKLVPPEAGKLNIFISYSRDDIAFADQLDATLKIGGFSTTIDRHGIHAGEDWKTRLGALVRDADTVVFVLTPNSARSEICAWEAEEARRLGKRIMPVLPGPLADAKAPPGLATLNYILFYDEPKKPGSGFGAGLLDLIHGLKTDLDWLREHTRLLQRATEWDAGGRPENRLLSGADIIAAKDWAARKPKDAPEPTALHLDFLRAAEEAEINRADAQRQQLEQMAAAQAERERALADAEAALKREAVERTGREEAQRQAAEAAQREAEQARRVARRTMAGLVASLVLAVAAGGAGYFAWTQWQAAVTLAASEKQAREEATRQAAEAKAQATAAREQTAIAERRKRETETVKIEGQTTASALLAIAARKVLDDQNDGDVTKAVLLALEALPDVAAGLKLLYVPEAEVQLDRAFRSLKERTVFGHDDLVSSAAFSADGARVVTASDDKTARLWEAATGKSVATLAGHEGDVRAAAFSPDGKLVVTGSSDNTARLWEAATGKSVATLAGHEGDVRAAVFSPDGKLVVTASSDKTARLWDASNGKELARLGHDDAVLSAAFSADGARVVTASFDKTARLWDASNGKELARLGHDETVWSAAFSADGLRMVTTSGTAALLWHVFPTTQHLVNAAKARAPHCLTRAQRAAYFLPESPPLWCAERRLWPYQTDDWQTWLAARKAGNDAPLPAAVAANK